MALPLPTRASATEIGASKQWDLGAVFELEDKAIKDWLSSTANSNLKESNWNEPLALEAAQVHERELANIFAVQDKYRDAALLGLATSLRSQAPARGVVATYAVLGIVAGVAEVSVFVAMAYMGLSNWMVVVVGLLLALFGWMLGFGSGQLVVEQPHVGNRSEGRKSRWLYFGCLVVGSLGLAVVTAIRAQGAGEGTFAVVGITTALAATVAVFTALELVAHARRRARLQDMFLCQQWWATDRHINSFEHGIWADNYRLQVRNHLAAARKTLGGGSHAVRALSQVRVPNGATGQEGPQGEDGDGSQASKD